MTDSSGDSAEHDIDFSPSVNDDNTEAKDEERRDLAAKHMRRKAKDEEAHNIASDRMRLDILDKRMRRKAKAKDKERLDIDFSPSVNDDNAEAIETLHQRRKHRAEIHRTGGHGMSDDEMERLEAKDEERRDAAADRVRLDSQHTKAARKQERKCAREDALVEQGTHEAELTQEQERKRRSVAAYIIFFLLAWIWFNNLRLTVGWLAVLGFLLSIS